VRYLPHNCGMDTPYTPGPVTVIVKDGKATTALGKRLLSQPVPPAPPPPPPTYTWGTRD